MISGYEKAAQMLSGLTGEDREWVLLRLAETDRLRIGELLEQVGAAAQQQDSAPEVPTVEPASSPETAVANATAADVARVLQAEPDWLVALILAKRNWPWGEDYLSRFEPARLERLREMVGTVRESAKPRACDEATAALAAKLQAPLPGPRNAFEDVLAGMIVPQDKAPRERSAA
jgi:hypothetical protein